MGATPGEDILSQNYLFNYELHKITNKDFQKEITINDHVLLQTAKSKGLSIEEYKKRLADDLKSKAIEKLEKEFGYGPEKLTKQKKNLSQMANKHITKLDQLLGKPENSK